MKTLLLSLLALGAATGSAWAGEPQLGKASIEQVIAAMTLEEKAHLVVGASAQAVDNNGAPVVGQTLDLVPGAAGTTYAIPRLGIPSVVLADGPAGLRINPTREGDAATYYCTHFPIGTLLASTWNTELVENVGRAIGNEVLEYGADVLLAPGMNIHRNPLCGRNFEYYSEDPLVAGLTAAAYIRGVQSNGVGTSAKHFAANSQESNRQATDARISERALREIYLRGFERMVKEAHPWTIMTSYNFINGTYASESEDLLEGILRGEWGFKGMVMTDWFGGRNPIAQMQAGNDLLEPGVIGQVNAIVEAVKNGQLSEKTLDRNIRRILELVMKTPRFRGYKYSNQPDLKAHAAVTRQSATEGMVLLKNDNATLPVAPQGKHVALFGCTSYDFIAGGTGSGNVNRAYTVSLLDGLRNAGYKVDLSLQPRYAQHIADENKRNANPNPFYNQFFPLPRPAEMIPTEAEMQAAVNQNDLALITLGRLSGEFLDRTPADFNLRSEEMALINQVADAFHKAGKPVVVVLNVGGVIETASWRNKADAILLAWQAGQEGGNSVADILSGKVNPSGKLTMTWPISYEDHASSANFPTEGRMPDFNTDPTKAQEQKAPENLWDYTHYEEDIYVGYRYFDTFGKPVAYPFGFGLSYTSFDYGKLTVKAVGDELVATTTITNKGSVAGKEVVELYATAPDAQTANKPAQELRAYAKTKLLAPGERQTVELRVKATDLASYNTAKETWQTTAGNYLFRLGASSADIKSTASVKVSAQETPATKRLAPQVAIKTITR